MSNNYLFHHGIKGQKWGVKNGPPYPIQTRKNVLLKKGSIAYRVSNIDNETNKGYAFISYKETDHKKYVSHVTALQEVFGNEILGFDMTFRVTNDLVSPTKKQAVDNLIKLIDTNPELKKLTQKQQAKCIFSNHLV